MALHLAEPWLDIQQHGGQPALALIGVSPAIHLSTTLFHQGIDGFQVIGRLEGQA